MENLYNDNDHQDQLLNLAANDPLSYEGQAP